MYNIIDIIAMDGNYSYNKVIDKGYNIYIYTYTYTYVEQIDIIIVNI